MDVSISTAKSNGTIEESIHDESPFKRQHVDLSVSRLLSDDDDGCTCPLCARSATDFAGSQQIEQHKKFCKGTSIHPGYSGENPSMLVWEGLDRC